MLFVVDSCDDEMDIKRIRRGEKYLTNELVHVFDLIDENLSHSLLLLSHQPEQFFSNIFETKRMRSQVD